MNECSQHDPHGWRTEARDLLRAIAGGAIVGMPLLYTMEMWQHGMTLSEWHLLVVLCAMLAANFVFSLLSGFRDQYSIASALSESVTSIGIAILLSAAILWLVGELRADIGIAEWAGKVLFEAAAVSIGVSFANSQFSNRSRTGDDDDDERSNSPGKQTDLSPNTLQLRADLREMAAALAGATVFALNVAPTEEITLIATRLPPWRLLVMLGAAVAFCYIILFAAEFREHRVHVPGIFQHPVSETILTCGVSLCVAATLLLLLGEPLLMNHPATAVAATVTLGLPAIVGGAAGRLIA